VTGLIFINTKSILPWFPLLVAALCFAAVQILSWLYLTERDKRCRSSRTDHLTRIKNRLGFVEGIRREMEMVHRYGGELGLILFDVDNFMGLKGKFGQAECGRILSGLAEFLAGTIRSSDLFARWGDEEFVVLLTRCGSKDALKRAEKLGESVEKAILCEKSPVTLSLGVTSYHPGESLEELVARAGQGLKQAKEEGRNRARLVN